MDNILFWNARGAGSNSFRSAVRDLVKMNSVDFLFICEPKVQFSNFKKHLKKLGFNDSKVVEANGFSGGLWAMWNTTKTNVDVIDSTTRSISLQVFSSGQSWILTCLYASPGCTSRQELWNYLTAFHSTHNLSWLVLGDFNEITAYADKNGGSYTGKFGGLHTWVQNDAMIDLGFQGADFTWSNGRVKERLDRCFSNSVWRLGFPEAKVVHLPKKRSDQCHVLVNLQPQIHNQRTNPPFRFQAMWMQHSDYATFVKESWQNSNVDLLQKTECLASSLNIWNKNIFGNVFRQKEDFWPDWWHSESPLSYR